MLRQCAKTTLGRLSVFIFAAGAIALAAQSTDNLIPYTSCQFSDGLQIVQTDPLASGIASREVETDSGPRRIDLLAGRRIIFAYPNTDFYANVKAESLPTANYAQFKGFLLDNLQYLSHSNIVNAALHSPLNGFEIHGIDREKLEGGVLGIYLLFDDASHVVTTIYMLNQEPQERKFQSMGEYGTLRDRFLASYSACIRKNQQNNQ